MFCLCCFGFLCVVIHRHGQMSPLPNSCKKHRAPFTKRSHAVAHGSNLHRRAAALYKIKNKCKLHTRQHAGRSCTTPETMQTNAMNNNATQDKHRSASTQPVLCCTPMTCHKEYMKTRYEITMAGPANVQSAIRAVAGVGNLQNYVH